MTRTRKHAIAFETAAVHDPATKRPADNPLGQQGGIYQRVEIDTGFDTHLMGHEHHVFGADVSRGRAMGVAGKRTASKPRD